jgi:NAD(P)H-dependent flavin oxidoreductase YrpB (nitropropane dioxygenase family)
MSFRTPICDLFEIEHLIFLAGMGQVAYAEVCAAVSGRAATAPRHGRRAAGAHPRGDAVRP